jgi:hypothetical protein
MNDITKIEKPLLGMPHNVKVRAAEMFLKQLPQTFIPVQNFFGHGIYTRIGLIPKDTLVTGKEHLKGQHNILVMGSIEMETENGPVVLHAPEVVVSPPGTKRAARTLTDVIWATILANPENITDPDEIERQFIHPIDCTAPKRIEGED